MRYALINSIKTEATKEAKGFCPSCGSELIARTGETRIHHWAHKGNRDCDPWWENETDWHRSWKNNFPKDWQEVVHTDEKSGEKHRADVKTDSNWVLEFQHSTIKNEERFSRNSFYHKLVWVIDGVTRQRDRPKFHQLLEEYSLRSYSPHLKRIMAPDDCKLNREWHKNDMPVFFDFQDTNIAKQPIVWFLFPKIADNEAHLWPIPRADFIAWHINNKFDEIFNKLILPFVQELIKKEKMKVEMEAYRYRQGIARANNFHYGRKIRRKRF